MSAKKKSKTKADFGLGQMDQKYRSINHDGSFNYKKIRVPFLERFNFFHHLITMSWSRFFLVIVVSYFTVNFLFASIYVLIGTEHLTLAASHNNEDDFIEAFFFSAQTITTLGYGKVAPIGFIANSVAAFESMLGLLSFALATGLLYGRFSKPVSKIKYSDIAVIAPYKDINAFMFRIVNPQNNQLLEITAEVIVSLKRDDDHMLRDFHALSLERKRVFFFPSVWTIVHPIDQKSPLLGLTAKDYKEKDAEFIIMLRAFDESSGQHVYSRCSYKCEEIKWGYTFEYLVSHQGESILVDVSKLNNIKPKELHG